SRASRHNDCTVRSKHGRFLSGGDSMASSFSHSDSVHRPSTPAGGMASPPVDPPSASPTPQRGQQETNRDSPTLASSSPSFPEGERKKDDVYSAAFDFGWQSR